VIIRLRTLENGRQSRPLFVTDEGIGNYEDEGIPTSPYGSVRPRYARAGDKHARELPGRLDCHVDCGDYYASLRADKSGRNDGGAERRRITFCQLR